MTAPVLGPAAVVRADARRLPLRDESVDLIVTSPPYYALRSYSDDGGHFDGQIGSEASPAEWLAAMLDATAEMVRVLKPTGSLWVNLGDKYVTAQGGRQAAVGEMPRRPRPGGPRGRTRPPRIPRAWGERDATTGQLVAAGTGLRPKSLMGLPWRYALACLDELGLILRRDVIWEKPNQLPEAVTDRCRGAHEYWFHLVREPRYFADLTAVREPYAAAAHAHAAGGAFARDGEPIPTWGLAGSQSLPSGKRYADRHPLGKPPSSVRRVTATRFRPPAELGVEHFAAFPPAWPAWCIAGWSPRAVCTACGHGRRPLVERQRETFHGAGRHRSGAQQVRDGAARTGWAMDEKWRTAAVVVGETCGCPTTDARTRPAVVLDPFGGSGTTALAARTLGRVGISADLSFDYARLARWRVFDSDGVDRLRASRCVPELGWQDTR